MQFRILGTVDAVLEGVPMSLPRAQLRGTLGYLLTHSNRVVSVVELIEAVWGGAAPATARSQVYTMVAQLRRTFRDMGEPERLHTSQSGYFLSIGSGELDADVFADLRAGAGAAVRARDWSTAEELLVRALGLWRGSALKDARGSYVDLWQAKLEEKRLLAQEELAEVWLAQGKHGELAAELPGLIARYPHRESLFRPYMLALYRCAREPEALQAGRALARRLSDEFGIDPAERTAELISAMLRHDPGLNWKAPGASADSRPSPVLDEELMSPDAPGQRNLPYRPLFVGRHHELADMDAAFAHASRHSRGAMILLHGRSGSGKSSLALEWAHRNSREFDDGVLYVQRGRCLETPRDPRLGDPQADFLLVLDGEPSSGAVRRWLPASIRATVIVVSRRRLDGLLVSEAAHPVLVGSLDPDDAVALLERTVVHAERLINRQTLLDLAERCDHWPLALRIAAARISSEPGLTAAGMVEQMGEPSAALDSLRLRRDGYSLVEALQSAAGHLSEDAIQVVGKIGAGTSTGRDDRRHPPDLARVLPELAASGLTVLREGHVVVRPLFVEHVRRSHPSCIDGV